ncbi:MAG: hypothetical protein U9R69_06150, partial [Thermodesulfobacteriota bacterium]|nr:hypothetical protein [Thermodesulfobacteriota bacterium]
MKRLLMAVVVLLFFSAAGMILFWSSHYFFSYALSNHDLSVEASPPQFLSLGTPAVIDLHGTGFTRETSVSLFMDVNSNEAVIGSLPLAGIYHDSLLYENFLYLASEKGGIQVLNVAEPQQPKLLKEYLVGRAVIDIHRNRNYLYLSCGKSGVSIMQIGADGLLDQVASIPIDSTVTACRFMDGFLYVAAGSSGLLSYDVRRIEQIRLVKILSPDRFISKLAVSEDFLYLAGRDSQIEIYHLGRSGNPLSVGFLELADIPHDLAIQREQLYVASGRGLSLYGLENGSQPSLLGEWTSFGAARRIFLGAAHLYVSDSFSGLRIIDSAVESVPGFINLNIDPRTIAETANYLFIAGSNKGLLVVDKNALLTQQVIKMIATPGSARDLVIKNHWIYVADSRGGVLMYDLAAGGATGVNLTLRRSRSLAVHRDLLFVAQEKLGIEVFDISTPGQPEPVAVWSKLQSTRLAVVNNYLLSSRGAYGVELIDISAIHQPIIRDVLPDVHALDIVSDGSHVYIASKNEGLLIYEITEDSRLNRLSRTSTPFPMHHFDLAVAVQVRDGIAYVANGRSGLLIVDVTNPEAPDILSSVAIPGRCKAVRVVGEKAFIISHHGGINVVNIENLEKSILLNSIFIPGLTRGLQIVDGLIYAAQKEMGVTVLPVPILAEDVEFISRRQLRVTLPAPAFPGRYSLQISTGRESAV